MNETEEPPLPRLSCGHECSAYCDPALGTHQVLLLVPFSWGPYRVALRLDTLLADQGYAVVSHTRAREFPVPQERPIVLGTDLYPASWICEPTDSAYLFFIEYQGNPAVAMGREDERRERTMV